MNRTNNLSSTLIVDFCLLTSPHNDITRHIITGVRVALTASNDETESKQQWQKREAQHCRACIRRLTMLSDWFPFLKSKIDLRFLIIMRATSYFVTPLDATSKLRVYIECGRILRSRFFTLAFLSSPSHAQLSCPYHGYPFDSYAQSHYGKNPSRNAFGIYTRDLRQEQSLRNPHLRLG